MEQCFFSQATAAAYLKINRKTFCDLLVVGIIPPADFDLGGIKKKRRGWRASTLAKILGEMQRRQKYVPLSNPHVAKVSPQE